jgi:hypothetical protein
MRKLPNGVVSFSLVFIPATSVHKDTYFVSFQTVQHEFVEHVTKMRPGATLGDDRFACFRGKYFRYLSNESV